jgi:hypothetical protein
MIYKLKERRLSTGKNAGNEKRTLRKMVYQGRKVPGYMFGKTLTAS